MVGIELAWLTEEETVIHWKFRPGWTVEELIAGVERTNVMFAHRQSGAVILDVAGQIPPGIIPRLPEAKKMDVGKVRLVMVVGVTSLGQRIAAIYNKVFQPDMRFVFVETLEQACGRLEHEGFIKANPSH